MVHVQKKRQLGAQGAQVAQDAQRCTILNLVHFDAPKKNGGAQSAQICRLCIFEKKYKSMAIKCAGCTGCTGCTEVHLNMNCAL